MGPDESARIVKPLRYLKAISPSLLIDHELRQWVAASAERIPSLVSVASSLPVRRKSIRQGQ